MRVVFFQRKPRSTGNYSLEAIFCDVRQRLPGIDSTLHIAPFVSNGLFRRLAIMIDAAVHQADINHVTGDITYAALLLSGKRTVLTILDCIGVDTRRGIAGWLYRKLWFEWPVLRSAVVTTISDATKSDIVRITRCDPNKIVVTGVAISPRYERVDRPFQADCPKILQVGTAPNKNLERLAAALKGMVCRLIVVGRLNDSQTAALLENKIAFDNFVRLTDDELREQYIASDVIAFASTFEGFGMPILEGNAVGRPVVTGNCKSMPEVAGDAACIVDPFCVPSIRAGFDQVISDAAYRERLVKNGFKNAARFDPDVIAERYLSVYRQVAAGEYNKRT